MLARVVSHRRFSRSFSRIRTLAVVALAFFIPSLDGSVTGSRHDLSTGTSPEVCVFCHTPHTANPNLTGFLWNRAETTQVFIPYNSPTMQNPPDQPSPISILCLGCHDGVISQVTVYGVVRDNKHQLLSYDGFPDNTSSPNCERCHSDLYSGKPPVLSLGTNLSDDHPISMLYPTGGTGMKFNTPPSPQEGWGTGDVRLVNGKVECVSCHNVHDPSIYPFMIKSNDGSALCMTCHKK